MVRVLCEYGCDVNLFVSVGFFGFIFGVKEIVVVIFLLSDYCFIIGRMFMLIRFCIVLF